MSEQNNGGPAFPVVHPPVEGVTAGGVEFYGLSIRDYFAAKAMQARISQPLPANLKDVPREQISSMVSELAYEMADAMLKARG